MIQDVGVKVQINNMGKCSRSMDRLLRSVLSENLGKRILFLLCINIISTILILYHCVYSNSMALTAFAYLSIFNILRLCSAFISIWVHKQKPNFFYSYGYERFEVLSVFVCTAVTQLSGFFIFKESFERLIQQDKVSSDSQVFMAILGTLVNIFVNYGIDNKAFVSVSRGASSNLIQDTLFDFGKSICSNLPFFSRFLMVRYDPYMLLSHTAAFIIFIESLLVEYKEAYEADTISAMLIAILICVTMYPLSHHCAMILMHAAPKDLMNSIDKCLKEANTLDGLLEFRKEHFWTISFGKYAGSLLVRIRRDANEQLLLAQLTNKLSPYLHHITIQIVKDDWKTSQNEGPVHHNHSSGPSLPYTPFSTGARTSLPYSNHVSITSNTTANTRPLIRYAPGSYAQVRQYNPVVTKSNPKQLPSRPKYVGPKIDINFE